MLTETITPIINIIIKVPTIGCYREKDHVIEILNEQIVYKNGCFHIVKRWLRGVHPDRGQITKGYTGLETLEEKTIIKPYHKFIVKEIIEDYQI